MKNANSITNINVRQLKDEVKSLQKFISVRERREKKKTFEILCSESLEAINFLFINVDKILNNCARFE